MISVTIQNYNKQLLSFTKKFSLQIIIIIIKPNKKEILTKFFQKMFFFIALFIFCKNNYIYYL